MAGPFRKNSSSNGRKRLNGLQISQLILTELSETAVSSCLLVGEQVQNRELTVSAY